MFTMWLAACTPKAAPDGRTDPDTTTSPTADTGRPADTDAPHTGPRDHTASTPPPPPLETFRQPGSYRVDATEAAAATTSCRSMAVSVYTPAGSVPTAVAVVAHGFAGRRADMEGWGAHLASWGLMALVPQLCHAVPLNTDHYQNGLDLVALADELAPGQPRFYVGYSAGGLAALVAASYDPATGGYLGLDAVDSAGVGAAAVPGISAPAAALYAEPSLCNSQNNAVLLYDGSGISALQIPGADHCDWMNPVPASCALLCATGPAEPRIPEAIATLGTSWLLWQAGLDGEGESWWTPGADGYEQLLRDGWIVP